MDDQIKAERIASLERQIQELGWDDGSWAAGKHWKDAERMGKEKLASLRTELAELNGAGCGAEDLPADFGAQIPDARAGAAFFGRIPTPDDKLPTIEEMGT